MQKIQVLILSDATVYGLYHKKYKKVLHKNSVWNAVKLTNFTIEGTQDAILKQQLKVDAVLWILPENNDLAQKLPPVIDNVVISCITYKSLMDLSAWFTSVENYRFKRSDGILATMQKPFYIKWAKRFYNKLKLTCKQKIVYRPPESTTKQELAHLFAKGFSFCIYTGHGRSRGWSGYRGFRWEDLAVVPQIESSGLVLSLSCSAFLEERQQVPFALQWVRSGRLTTFCGFRNAVHIQPLVTLSKYILEYIQQRKSGQLYKLIHFLNNKVIANGDIDLMDEWKNFCIVGNPLVRLW